MLKVHSKNDFEFRCERYYFAGYWSVTWFYKPINCKIFLAFSVPGQEKTVNADTVKFLEISSAATEKYQKQLSDETNIERLVDELKRAEKNWEKVNSPDLDLRGNNPNKEIRAWENAKSALSIAEYRLHSAIKYVVILVAND